MHSRLSLQTFIPLLAPHKRRFLQFQATLCPKDNKSDIKGRESVKDNHQSSGQAICLYDCAFPENQGHWRKTTFVELINLVEEILNLESLWSSLVNMLLDVKVCGSQKVQIYIYKLKVPTYHFICFYYVWHHPDTPKCVLEK